MQGILWLAVLAAHLSGCAAMTLTWQFEAKPVSGDRVELTVFKAAITQKTAYLAFDVKNISDAPLMIEAGIFFLTLPDGDTFQGKTSMHQRTMRKMKGLLSQVGLGDEKSESGLPPGEALRVKLAFRQYGRDLRRHPILKVNLGGLTVNGESAGLPDLELVAPAEAPIGEGI